MAKITFITSCIAFIFSALLIYLNDNIYEELTLAFLMGTAFSIPATLLTQKLTVLKKYLIQGLTAATGFVLGFFLTAALETIFIKSFIILESFAPSH